MNKEQPQLVTQKDIIESRIHALYHFNGGLPTLTESIKSGIEALSTNGQLDMAKVNQLTEMQRSALLGRSNFIASLQSVLVPHPAISQPIHSSPQIEGYRKLYSQTRAHYARLEQAQIQYYMTGNEQDSYEAAYIKQSVITYRDVQAMTMSARENNRLAEISKSPYAKVYSEEDLDKPILRITDLSNFLAANGLSFTKEAMEFDFAFTQTGFPLTLHAAMHHLGLNLAMVDEVNIEAQHAQMSLEIPEEQLSIKELYDIGYEELQYLLSIHQPNLVSQELRLIMPSSTIKLY